MTTFALNNLWAYLQGLSLSQNDREWLANKLIMPKETNLVEDDNARLISEVQWRLRRLCRCYDCRRGAPTGSRYG